MNPLEAPLEGLPMWVVYDHPTDYPGHWVARKHAWDSERGKYWPTGEHILRDDQESIAELMRAFGLVFLRRHPLDDAAIAGTWL